ncbi:hypothetical protein MRB53_038850 [Persea americana]|nr:hypothetical protein MRB53_038850 [Persea americana]
MADKTGISVPEPEPQKEPDVVGVFSATDWVVQCNRRMRIRITQQADKTGIAESGSFISSRLVYQSQMLLLISSRLAVRCFLQAQDWHTNPDDFFVYAAKTSISKLGSVKTRGWQFAKARERVGCCWRFLGSRLGRPVQELDVDKDNICNGKHLWDSATPLY